MKRNRPKIAFIHPDLGIGGAERLVIDMANALNNDYEIMFLVNHFEPKHCFDELKTGQYQIKVIGDWIPRSLFGKCHAICAYIRMIYLILIHLLFGKHNHGIDLYIVDLIPIAIPFLKRAKQRVIYYCHHPDLLATSRATFLKKLYRKPIDWVEYKASESSDITLVNSEYTKMVFLETFPQINKHIQILYPTISSSVVELLSSIDHQVNINDIVDEIPNNASLFLSVNRFHPAKKLEMAIEAMGHLKSLVKESQWKQIYLIMAGGYDKRSDINSEYFKQLQDITRSLNVSDKVIFMKSPTDYVKAQLLHACTCLVYTPVKEHFGIVPLEAMMAEKPVIACNSGGPRETIDHGYNGYLCEPDAKSLAEFMAKMLNDNFQQLGKNGKKRLDSMFSNEIFSDKLKNIIEKTLQSET